MTGVRAVCVMEKYMAKAVSEQMATQSRTRARTHTGRSQIKTINLRNKFDTQLSAAVGTTSIRSGFRSAYCVQ